MTYELIREIFNSCSNNQMRDVFVTEIETQDPDVVAASYCTGKHSKLEKQVLPDGVIVYDLWVDDLHERLTFSPD